MFERPLEQKKYNGIQCGVPASHRALFSTMVLAEKVAKLLKVFEEATQEISGEYCSASVIIPIINTLKRTIS